MNPPKRFLEVVSLAACKPAGTEVTGTWIVTGRDYGNAAWYRWRGGEVKHYRNNIVFYTSDFSDDRLDGFVTCVENFDSDEKSTPENWYSGKYETVCVIDDEMSNVLWDISFATRSTSKETVMVKGPCRASINMRG